MKSLVVKEIHGGEISGSNKSTPKGTPNQLGVNHNTNRLIKSHSDTTIYVLALKRNVNNVNLVQGQTSNTLKQVDGNIATNVDGDKGNSMKHGNNARFNMEVNDNTNIDHISNFIENIRMNSTNQTGTVGGGDRVIDQLINTTSEWIWPERKHGTSFLKLSSSKPM